MKTIVVGYTNTPEGHAALERAIQEAELRDARLEVVHSRKEGEQRDAPNIQLYAELLAGIDRRLDAAGIEHDMHDYIRGNTAAQDILDCADTSQAELVVIGFRNRTKTGKYLLGSTAQDVLLQARCAVLAVKAAADIDRPVPSDLS